MDRLPEYVHVVDSLAHERAFFEDVLIDVGYGVCIGIDAGLAGEESGESGAAGTGDADADARLEDAVSLGHAAELFVKVRTVQGVGHGADEMRCGISRELSVAVQRDYISNVLQCFGGADDGVEAASFSAQSAVEVFEFSSLSFPAHPDVLAFVPTASPVK